MKPNSSWVVVKCEPITYQSKNNLVGHGLEKGGAGVKGEVIVPNGDFSLGDNVEFQRNLGTEIRKDVYAIKAENIYFTGDLDLVLETINKKENER